MPPDRDEVIELMQRRAALLDRRRSGGTAAAELDEVTDALRRFLDGQAAVRRLALDGSEADNRLARSLAAAEPVNPVAGRADLEDRFDIDRRVFVLEHPALPGHPMNVVWVALRQGLPDRLGDILDHRAPTDDPHEADTAAFYSIWNAESGLAGLGRGRDLLEGTVELLRQEFGGLSTFVTLSPVPGLRNWLGIDPAGSEPTALDVLAARYLTGFSDRGRLLDPVARFHMGNGARLFRLCPDADPSPRGRQRSFAMMANYRYFPEDRAANRAALAERRPAVGEQVERLLGH